MAANVIEEFLVSLGFKVDNNSMAAFHKGISVATIAVKGLVAAAATMAVAVEEAVRRTTNTYASLYYLSQQTGSMVADLDKLSFAFTQVGLSSQQLQGTLQRLASNIRDNPSLTTYIGSVTNTAGIKTAQQALEALTKEYARIIKAGEQEYVIRQAISFAGGNPEEIRQAAVNFDDLAHAQERSAKWVGILGFNQERLSANSRKFKEESDSLWKMIGLGIQRLVDSSLPAFLRILGWITDWVENKALVKFKEWGEAIEQYFGNEENWDRIKAGFKTATDAAELFLNVMEGLVTAAKWLFEHPVFSGAVLGAVVGSRAGPWGALAGAAAGASAGKYLEYQQYQADKERKKEEFLKKGGSAEAFEEAWIQEHPWAPETVDPKRPHQYGETPLGGAQGSGSTIVDLLAYMNQGFQHWWAGSNAFRPLVQFAEDVYDKLVEALRDGLGLGPGTGAGGAAAGARAGAERVQSGAGTGGSGGGGDGGGGGGGTGASPNTEGTGRGHVASKSERLAYYRQKAIELGLNPDAVVQTVANEGLNDYVGDAGKSFGDFQLYTGGGMGNQAVNAGIDITNPETWKKQADFAMGEMAKNKGNAAWFASQWHGPRDKAPWAVQNFGNPSAIPPGGSFYDTSGKPREGGGGGDGNYVTQNQRNEARTRNQAISAELSGQLDLAGSRTGIRAEVFSGGQPSSGPNRVGSHRHDEGGAADVRLYDAKTGRILNMNNPADRERMAAYATEAVRAGVTGIGAAEGYMGPSSMHLGGGPEAVWGEGGSGANAPEWMVNAYNKGRALRDRRASLSSKSPAMAWLKNGGGGDFNMAGLPMDAQEPSWSYDPGDRPQRETKVNTANNTTNHISVSGVEDPDRAAKRIRQEMENLEKRYAPRAHQTAIA